jgi:HAD superfamily hydrolase (TIGR01509 family)
MGLRGVLLDVDGTLLDSNDAHALAWVDALAHFGFEVSYERVRPLIGMGGDKVLRALAQVEKESPLGTEISDYRAAVFKKRYLPDLAPFDGTRELLERMRGAGAKLVVATSARGDELAHLLRHAGVEDLVQEEATSSDAAQSKPDPDIVHAAIARARLAPHELAMLGDTPYDVEACRRAGVRCVAFRCGGWFRDEDFGEAVTAIYDGPRDLLRRWSESLFATLGRSAA